MKVWIQKWEESERGWGTRPDGYTLHKSRGDINLYLKAMRDRETAWMKQTGSAPNYVPDEYSRPCGEPYEADITDEALLKKLDESEHGCWGNTGNRYPAPITSGEDNTGWCTVSPATELEAEPKEPLMSADEAQALVAESRMKLRKLAAEELQAINKMVREAASLGLRSLTVSLSTRDSKVAEVVEELVEDLGYTAITGKNEDEYNQVTTLTLQVSW